jgi:hypothetical protein
LVARNIVRNIVSEGKSFGQVKALIFPTTQFVLNFPIAWMNNITYELLIDVLGEENLSLLVVEILTSGFT